MEDFIKILLVFVSMGLITYLGIKFSTEDPEEKIFDKLYAKKKGRK